MKIRVYHNSLPHTRVFNFVIRNYTKELVIHAQEENRSSLNGRIIWWTAEYSYKDKLRKMIPYKRGKVTIGTLEIGFDHRVPNQKFYEILMKLIKIKYDI